MSRPRNRRRLVGKIGAYVFLIGAAGFASFPIVWGLFSSFKDERSIIAYPPRLLPEPITTVHYTDVLLKTPMMMFFWNSAVVSVAAVVLTSIVAFHGAYVLARIRFRGKAAVLLTALATKMIPGISILIPLFLLVNYVGLYDNHLALILTFSAWNVPIALWLLRGFIEAVPYEVEEAAQMDGCARLAIMYRIVLPLIKPGMISVAIITFVFAWNDFLIPIILTTSESKTLLQVGLYRYYGDPMGVSWGRFMAYTMLASLPIVVVFFALNRRFIEGFVSGSVKG